MRQFLLFLSMCFFCSGTLASQPHAVVLLYHHVDTSTPAVTSITPQQFDQQLDYLQNNGFTVLALADIVRRLETGEALPDKVVSLSFDDAYRSVYSEAFPRLKQRKWPFTVFVNTEAVDNKHAIQSSWEQLREMAENGASIANHSVSHSHLARRLDGETEAAWKLRVTAEITNAQQRIQEEIGTTEKLFAYPYGEFDLALKTLVKDLGYTAFGQQSGAWGPMTDAQSIPRFAFAGQYVDIKDFALKASTLPFEIVKASTDDNPLAHEQKKPQLQLEFRPGNYQQLNCFGSGQGALALTWLSETMVVITPNKAIPVGRSRVNCTMPAGDGRFYWYSHQWIRLDKNQQWILD
jgi:biofilm PGA synthesis lipoprotein PgaB